MNLVESQVVRKQNNFLENTMKEESHDALLVQRFANFLFSIL